MGFAEGCYRLPGADWQVFTAWAEGIEPTEVRLPVRWDSGVTGMNIVFANGEKINTSSLLQKMSDVLGVSGWRVVRGPDSMQLR